MTGIVVVSHSRELARAAVDLARALVPGLQARVEVAAGDGGGGLGTDAVAIVEALARADDGRGVLVLADLGSAVLSARTALELVDPQVAARVRLSGAPLVEGLVAAYAAAGTGKDLEEVSAQAQGAAEAKRAQVS